jgi:predicted RNase H-like nuclease (RuvC/YqgF family)
MTVKTDNPDVSDDKDKDVDPSVSDGDKKDVVDYATHKKLLDQRKSDQKKLKDLEDKLSSFEKSQKDLKDKEDLDKGNYKTLLEDREKTIKTLADEINGLKTKVGSYESQITDAKKLSAFRKQIGGDLKKSQYYDFVDTDKIPLDPETGKIDEKALESYANEFIKEFKDLVKFEKTTKLPDDAGKPGSSLSYDAWLKLPLAEQRLRMKDVKD